MVSLILNPLKSIVKCSAVSCILGIVFLFFHLNVKAQSRSSCSGNGPQTGTYGNGGDNTNNPSNNYLQWLVNVVRPKDPNDITGPNGFDSIKKWVSVKDRLPYTIRFENDPKFATAPAQNVFIHLPIDPKININSLNLSQVGFGRFTFNIPGNLSYFSGRLDVRDSLGIYVDVTAGIDVTINEVFWIFRSIDPATGTNPADPTIGFLPVNDSTKVNDSIPGRGEGFVSFSLKPKTTDITTDTVSEKASIIFDTELPILTNTWKNTIDAVAPVSAIHSSTVSGDTITLRWSGVDDLNGTGVKNYTLYVSENNGPFSVYQSAIADTTIKFVGSSGTNYCFFTIANDNVGNSENLKDTCELSIQINNCATIAFTAGNITGPVNACPYTASSGVYANNSAIYSIAATDASFAWAVPNNATLLSGQGTSSIQVRYNGSFVSGNITVKAKGICNVSDSVLKTIRVIKSKPAVPDSIYGPLNACAFIGSGVPVTYSINPVPGAVTYKWSLPSFMTILSASTDSTSITVNFNSGVILGSSIIIKVRSISACGNSSDKILSIPTTIPVMPTVLNGPTNACLFIGTLAEATYKTNLVANASSYNWIVPAGATIISHPNGLGILDTVINVRFDNNFISPSNISVQALSGCGASEVKSLAVARINPTTPGTITGPTDPCPTIGTAAGAIYSINPSANTVNYNWTVPTGASIRSGQGTSSITVDFTSAYSAGSIQVQASNNCASSGLSTIYLLRRLPSAPGAITTAVISNVCPFNRQYSYSIPSIPRYASSVFWTAPSGGVIISGQGTTTIIVEYGPQAIDDSIKVIAINNCSNSSVRKIRIRLAACPPVTAVNSGKLIQQEEIKPKQNAQQALEVDLFPNPSPDNFNLLINSKSNEEINVRLIDMAGRQLKSFVLIAGEKLSFGMDLKSGTYMVEIKQGENTVTEKIVKY